MSTNGKDCWLDLIEAVGTDHPLHAAMVARRELGIARYGTPLHLGINIDPWREMEEEMLDAAVYAEMAGWRDGAMHLIDMVTDLRAALSLVTAQNSEAIDE